MRLILVVFSSFFLFSCSQTFYVVRHAEKAAQAANMSSDVPLSTVGKQRAERLGGLLHTKKIGLIYSTNTIRTRATAEPTANHFLLSINTYGPKPDSAFIKLLKSQKKNTLVVGHSNTVDDIVNMLCGETKVAGDLDETIYDNLYVIKRKGKKFIFRNDKF
ncbi:MAG: histidine phosphatase family protein [Bacteroidetes bacterium]|nr:MAG: histidine phosphatase family protein [Bacteroidota bacterium]